MSLCYYSTNSWIKWYVCNRWRADTHFAWCSEVFDPRAVGKSHYGSLIPPTSSPCAIYKDLAEAVRAGDRHNAKIVSQKAGIAALTEQWRIDGSVSNDDANEILAIVNGDEFRIWRPQLYIIPKTAIDPVRVAKVPLAARAGFGDEFVIKDLRGTEFERLEFDGS